VLSVAGAAHCPVVDAIIQRHCIGGMLRNGIVARPVVNAFIPNLMYLSGVVLQVDHYKSSAKAFSLCDIGLSSPRPKYNVQLSQMVNNW